MIAPNLPRPRAGQYRQHFIVRQPESLFLNLEAIDSAKLKPGFCAALMREGPVGSSWQLLRRSAVRRRKNALGPLHFFSGNFQVGRKS
jgi:hypothetical protein